MRAFEARTETGCALPGTRRAPRAFVTGATGFIGGALARALRAHGWDVTALVRSPHKAVPDGVMAAPGDITCAASLDAMAGHDAVFHLAAWYAIGTRDRAAMERINVEGTRNVLAAARTHGIARVVYCSSVAALGREAPGEIGDETAAHPGDFGSIYEETKHRAHLAARAAAREGLPVVTVMPGATYGGGDSSVIGLMLQLYARKLLVAAPFTDTGLSWVHVEDVAGGIVAAHDRGTQGEEYVLGGDNCTIGDMFLRIEPHTGIRAPRALPGAILRAAVPLGPIFARALGQEPNLLREGLASLKGSWMFSSAKAERELGYSYRSIEDGMPDVVTALRAR